MKRIFIFISTIFIVLNVNSQKKNTTLLNLQNNIEIARTDLKKIESRIALGDYLTEKEVKRAEQHFLDALKIINDNNLEKTEELKARIYVGLGVVNRRKGD